MTNYQDQIIRFVSSQGIAQTADIIARFRFRYYCKEAASRYVSQALTRLVKRQRLVRVSKGKYKVNDQVLGLVQADPGQMNLFSK